METTNNLVETLGIQKEKNEDPKWGEQTILKSKQDEHGWTQSWIEKFEEKGQAYIQILTEQAVKEEKYRYLDKCIYTVFCLHIFMH